MSYTSRGNDAKNGLISAFVQISIYLLTGLGFADQPANRLRVEGTKGLVAYERDDS
jgi:hypothetical protein